ncbi:hypothetical protein G3570_06430 [Balneolaceae bacterium YR4-1]|uniref:Uncharacterized protein n=1 Tax=Halalkalibaculum roseum TaxID=2709311 RepID=A0A6M1SLP9_9BACT|nr:hypothetical protein [Halalkalibaculum roseum]NGP76261.1 hypothetical protein [Halalkalibaculum roseum]
MKRERDYIQDIAEIRSMMERSSKFLSLSGWAGIMAGIYALAGAYIASVVYDFSPDRITYSVSLPAGLSEIILLALGVLILAIGTAVFLSYSKAHKRGEQVWNTTSRRMIIHMSVPLAAGGIFMIILLSKSLIGLLAPTSLVFYGLALYNAGNFTYPEIKYLGIIQIGLGLISCYFIEYSLMLWALGFGVVHIVYGIVMHFKYER